VKPLATVEVRYNGLVRQTTANERGFFQVRLPAGEALDPGWHAYYYRFPDRAGWQSAEFYVASEEKTAVISDIDDTILISHSTKAVRKFFLVLLRNASTRNPFPFMKRWFEDLKTHNEGRPPVDYFYVSDSEWNLYDFLVDFFEIHGIPKGVFY
jgi:phosphatidate phosphatase APP1